MSSVVDTIVAVAFGVLDALAFVVAFVLLGVLTVYVVPWSVRGVLVLTAVGAVVGVSVTAYSASRFRRDGQAFPAVRGLLRGWKRWIPWWL